MDYRRARRLLVAACACALLALALMTWQLFDPTVLPVIVAMSAGQLLGTASFALYLFVVVSDFRARLRVHPSPAPSSSDSANTQPRV